MNKEIQTHLSNQDPVLNDIIEQIELPSIKNTNNLFHDLISCIIEQQIHYRSTKKTFAKLLEKASLIELTPENFKVFEEKALPHIKLSMPKYETLGRVVDFFENSQIEWNDLTDDEVKKVFKDIKGVGKWTVDMLLLYSLERPDIFPADDYHLKKIMTRLYQIDPAAKLKKEMEAIAGNWIPYRSIGVKYMLAWKARK